MSGERTQSGRSPFPLLISLMLKEEYRMMSSAIGRWGFFSFPLLITIMASAFALMSVRLPYSTLMPLAHVSLALYGLSVGGFTLLGQEMLERRLGTLTTLLTVPVTLPLKFKTAFTAFYIKDSIVYLGFTLAPLVAGLLITMPITHYPLTGTLLLFLTLSLSFMTGISFSFFISSLYAKWRTVAIAFGAALALVAAAGYFAGFPVVTAALPSIGLQADKTANYLLLSLGYVLLYSLLAYILIEDRFELGKTRIVGSFERAKQHFSFFKVHGTLLSKDWIDIRRSRTQYRILTSYVAPLVVLAVMMWMFENALDVRLNFNVVGYGAIVGLVGTNIYTWLNYVDDPTYLELLPVKTSDLIKEKIIMFFLLTVGIVVAYILGASILSNSFEFLPIGVFVGLSSSTYVTMCTAYLTGTHAHEYFFDIGVVGRFAVLVMPPTIVLIVLSLMATIIPNVYMYMSFIAALMLVASYIFLERIERWDDAV